MADDQDREITDSQMDRENVQNLLSIAEHLTPLTPDDHRQRQQEQSDEDFSLYVNPEDDDLDQDNQPLYGNNEQRKTGRERRPLLQVKSVMLTLPLYCYRLVNHMKIMLIMIMAMIQDTPTIMILLMRVHW